MTYYKVIHELLISLRKSNHETLHLNFNIETIPSLTTIQIAALQ